MSSSEMIVRMIPVNRTRTGEEALVATGRKLDIDLEVVNNMPKGEGDEVEIVFFKLDLSLRNGSISDEDLEKEYDLRDLKPADPFSVVALNEADPGFADETPHGTLWKDHDGNSCCAVFYRWGGDGERWVDLRQNDVGWGSSAWFAGLRK